MPWVLLGMFIVVAAVIAGGSAMRNDLNERADANGVVQGDPYAIATAHGISVDAEALARLGPSEAGASRAAQIAVMWATVNYAADAGENVAALLLRGKTKAGLPSSSSGKFGAQNTGKYASTRLPSTVQSRADAVAILAGKIKDPTYGATQYDAPAAQDAAAAKGVGGYTKTSAQVAAERSKTSDLVTVPGVTAIRFWRPKDASA